MKYLITMLVIATLTIACSEEDQSSPSKPKEYDTDSNVIDDITLTNNTIILTVDSEEVEFDLSTDINDVGTPGTVVTADKVYITVEGDCLFNIEPEDYCIEEETVVIRHYEADQINDNCIYIQERMECEEKCLSWYSEHTETMVVSCVAHDFVLGS